MKIFLVFGQCGEYSDRREWTVKAFVDRSKAEALILSLEGELLAKGLSEHNSENVSPYSNEGEIAIAQMRTLDPSFQADYTGSRYYLDSCDLEE